MNDELYNLDEHVEQNFYVQPALSEEKSLEYAELKTANKQLKVSFLAMIITLFLVTLGAWFVFGNYADSFVVNEQKMESIYEELGDVRGENTNVYMELKKTQTELESVQATLENLNDKLGVIGSDGISQIKVDVGLLSKKLRDNSLIKTSAEDDGQVVLEYPEEMLNVLIIGQNQGLTDTIMVASVNPTIEQVTLISVPRDLYVNGRKINEIYHYHGVEKLKSALNDILGLRIDEYAAVDVEAFREAIDLLGGLDIYVEKDITDYSYPTENKGYQVFSLEAGQHHMDGSLAEKYARSRKSTSDFDRARRQQKIIESVFRKIKELKLTENKGKAIEMYNTLDTYVHTNIDVFSALAYARMFKNFEIERNNVLSHSNYLYSMINASGAYILLPRTGNYDEIKAYVFELVVE